MIKKIKRLILIILNRGNQYFCPLCDFRAKKLSLIGQDIPILKKKQVIGSGRRHGGCFKCGSRDRERLVYAYLKKELDIFSQKNLKLLHIAPEKRLSQKLLKSGFSQYICGDLFAPGYTHPPHVRNMNVTNLPFKTNFFDLIICNHVLEHVQNDLKAMKELFRVLKPGGQAILQTPISKNSTKTFEDFSITKPEDRIRLFGQFDHVRIYGQDYPQRLKKAGFKVNRLNLAQEFTQSGLNPEEDLFIGIKSSQA